MIKLTEYQQGRLNAAASKYVRHKTRGWERSLQINRHATAEILVEAGLMRKSLRDGYVGFVLTNQGAAMAVAGFCGAIEGERRHVAAMRRLGKAGRAERVEAAIDALLAEHGALGITPGWAA